MPFYDSIKFIIGFFFFYHIHCNLLFYFNQVGVRTEGLQEALQKTVPHDENADRITKIKRTIKAVSYL